MGRGRIKNTYKVLSTRVEQYRAEGVNIIGAKRIVRREKGGPEQFSMRVSGSTISIDTVSKRILRIASCRLAWLVSYVCVRIATNRLSMTIAVRSRKDTKIGIFHASSEA